MQDARMRAKLFTPRAATACPAPTRIASAISAGLKPELGSGLGYCRRLSVSAAFALAIAVTYFVGWSQSAFAEQSRKQFSIWPLATPIASSPNVTSAKPPCRCVFKGRRYEQGDMVCIKLPGSVERSVRCGLMLNNTSWITAPGACTPVS